MVPFSLVPVCVRFSTKLLNAHFLTPLTLDITYYSDGATLNAECHRSHSASKSIPRVGGWKLNRRC